MRVMVFDAGPIITLTMNNILWILKELNKSYKGEFYITESIKYELIDKPIEGKKFKFEALHTLTYLKKRILKVYKKPIREETNELAELINNIFWAKGKNIQVVHLGEVEALDVTLKLQADLIVIDERTLRLLIESPLILHKILQKKLHIKIKVDRERLNKFKQIVKGVKVVRSVDLATRAFELGILDKYLPHDMANPKKELLTALLWGLKLDGCSISQQEIDDIVGIEGL